MRAQAVIGQEERIRTFVDRVNDAPDDVAARAAYRSTFRELSSRWTLHPPDSDRASEVFESAAASLRIVAAQCLPLGMAIAMHLYPLCALQCIPLPRMHPARFKRALLLHTIRRRSLLLANAGSERARGSNELLIATPAADGIRIDGVCEYMSLSSVADFVLFKAQRADSHCAIVCAADLRADSVQIGAWKFSGSMRLSDTASVRFTRHLVPHGRYLSLPDPDRLQCASDYQRCWFQLFLAEIHLARMERLSSLWSLPSSTDQWITRNEVSSLRAYSLHLLDDFRVSPAIEALTRTTCALKLRVSLMAQAMSTALRSMNDAAAAVDAAELSHIRFQPTADTRILRGLGIEGGADL